MRHLEQPVCPDRASRGQAIHRLGRKDEVLLEIQIDGIPNDAIEGLINDCIVPMIVDAIVRELFEPDSDT